jgi:hypothetical protein
MFDYVKKTSCHLQFLFLIGKVQIIFNFSTNDACDVLYKDTSF